MTVHKGEVNKLRFFSPFLDALLWENVIRPRGIKKEQYSNHVQSLFVGMFVSTMV